LLSRKFSCIGYHFNRKKQQKHQKPFVMSSAYPLFTISILVVLFYALSAAFAGLGLVSKIYHRRFWNVLLLSAFLVTGIIGLISVLKINYKLEISGYDELLRYHVDFGIGMLIIGLIHLWWHLDYYFRIFKPGKITETAIRNIPGNDLDVLILKRFAFLLGITTMIAQIILLREFLTVFNGNELVIGIVLSNWMILTGIGAYLGKRPLKQTESSSFTVFALLILSVLPFITTFLINFLKNKVFPIGAMISVFQIFLASLILLIPFCLLSGFLFTFISKSYSGIRNKNETGAVYGLESLGGIVGGLVSGLIFIFIFSSVESLLILVTINGFLLYLISLKKGLRQAGWISIFVSIISLASFSVHPENRIRSYVYPNQKIETSKDSPYGNIVITRRDNLWSVYNNNSLIFDSENFMMNEETVHFAMLQHSAPSNVLLVSGGLSGQIAEIRKYKPLSIDYVEDNRWLLTLMKDSLKKIITGETTLYRSDPLRFIRTSLKKYDMVIMNQPGPSTLQNNRFYTFGFFTLLKEKLLPGAVLSFGITAPANYLNKEAVALNSTLFSTLKRVFQNVIIIPGEKNYFLASDAALSFRIVELVQKRGIENRYVNRFYFDDTMLKNRSETILASLIPDSEINQNLKPALYRQQLAYWLSYFKGKYWLMAITAGIIALLVFLSGSVSSKVMFLTGFSATGMEVLLLFGLQVFFGNIYLLTSFVISSFMIGLFAGSFFSRSIIGFYQRDILSGNQLLFAVFTAITGTLLFAPMVTNLPPAIVYMLYLTSTAFIGGLTGLQFTNATLHQEGSYAEISGHTYSYDLFGSALGALVIVLFLVPKLGIVASALIISLLNLIFGFCLTLRNKG